MNTPTIEAYSPTRNWLVAVSLSLTYTAPSVVYVLVGHPDTNLLQLTSFVFASVSSLLFGTALSLGSISYFTSWPDMSRLYQKQIGIMAFWWAVAYSITLPFLYPELYWYGLPDHFLSADVILGFSAMIIFGAMVSINSRLIAPYVQKKTIFFVLGLGYVGYAFLVIRAVLLESDFWLDWITTLNGFPPGRMLLSLIALGVLLLRVAVAIARHHRQPAV